MNLESNGYKLVWNDEFNKGLLDPSKWTLDAKMRGDTYLSIAGTENPDVVRVDNGKLKLATVDNGADAEKRYTSCKSVTTQHKMRFRYGYLEISARVPYMQGAWPSFWLKSETDDLITERKADYMTEVDIFEVFSNKSHLTPNLHKWFDSKQKYGTDHQQGGTIISGSKPYEFTDASNLCDEYHTYGFEWTPEFMAMSVDGEEYCRYGITDNDNFGYSDMTGFHDTLYVLFNNHIFTADPNRWKEPSWVVNEETQFPINYWIEYIRLYQKDGCGDLYVAE